LSLVVVAVELLVAVVVLVDSELARD